MINKVVQSAYLTTSHEPPMVAVTMDIGAWDYVLSVIQESAQRDEMVKTIRRTCQKAIKDCAPSVFMENQ